MDVAGVTAEVYLSAPAGYAQVTGAGDYHAHPIPISGATGSIEVTYDATVEPDEPALADANAYARTVWLLYTAPDTPGLLTMPVGDGHYVEVYATTDPAAGFAAMDQVDLWYDPTGAQRPADSPPVYTVRNGTLYLPVTPGGQYYLRTYPTWWGGTATLTWAVELRVAELVVTTTPMEITPGQLAVTVTNAAPDEALIFTVAGQEIAIETADSSGVLHASLPIDAELVAGTHVLTVTGAVGAVDADFTVRADPAPRPEPPPDAIGPAPTADLGVAWQVVDPTDDTRWDFPYNPSEASPPYAPSMLSLRATTYPGGQALTWEGATRAHEWVLRGYLDNADDYHQLEWYVTTERRYWLIDHHHRWRLVSFESFDPTYRRSVLNGGLNDWSFSYEVRLLVYRWLEA